MKNKTKKIAIVFIAILLIAVCGIVLAATVVNTYTKTEDGITYTYKEFDNGKVIRTFKSPYNGRTITETVNDVADTTNDANKTPAVLDSDYCFDYYARDIATYNNLYCVYQTNALDGAVNFYTDVGFQAKAMVDIQGTKATFYKIENGNLIENGTVTCTENNIMAGIVAETNPNSITLSNGTTFTPDRTIYKGSGARIVKDRGSTSNYNWYWYRYRIENTITQTAVHKYYNTWKNKIGNGKIFTSDNVRWSDFDDTDEAIAEQYINAIKNSGKIYRAKIYFCKKYKGDTESYTLQNLILVEKEDTIDIPVTKVWEDSNNANKNRPSSITVKLLNGNTTVQEIDLSGTGNKWTGTFKDVPEYDNSGNAINYTVQEVKVTGYTSSKSGNKTKGFTITNTLQTTDVSVTKSWADENNVSGFRPSFVEVKLYEGTTPTTQVPLNESNQWKHTFANLPKYKNGVEVKYTVKEESVPTKYEAKITGSIKKGFTVTNTYIPEKIDIKVTKVWNDSDNLDELRPSSITVKLYKNGTATNTTLTLNASNNWTSSFTDLYKYENGTEIKYTVQETTVPTGYTAQITGTAANGFTITNTHNVNYDGYVEITGKVWHDMHDEKQNDVNGILDNEEKGISGIKVRLKDANGNAIQSTYTDSNGNFNRTDYALTKADGTYTIRVNYDNSESVYKLYENGATVATKLQTAYVEFEYNATKYTTVATASTGADTSKAKENETTRNTFDSKYGTVSSTTDASGRENEMITATTKGVISFGTYTDKTTTEREEIIKYCNGNGTYTHTNINNAWGSTTITRHTCTNCPRKGHSMRTYDVSVETIQNVNLGLFEREQPDVAIFSDISNVKVTMQGQEYTYLYNVKSNEKDNVGLKAKFEDKGTYTYKRPVNSADIAYINKTNSNLMSIEVTYEISVANLSTTLPVTIHNIDNYYDSRYTLKTEGWTQNAGTEFNTAKYNGDLNITLQAGTESEKIELTYTVSLEAIKGLLNEDATFNNAVEIQSYSTKYGEKTVYAEQRTGGRTGNAYGGYDIDSHPGNAGIYIDNEGRLSATSLEDDTDIAPSLLPHKDHYKILSGNVWEDSDANAEDDYRLGDGKKAGADKNVENVKVELYKVKQDGTLELAQLYSSDNEEKDAITYTDKDGNYAFGSENYGVVTDKYIIKFTYGEGIEGSTINVRDYKSTIISQENINVYNLFKGTNNSDEWHLNASDGYSIAVDDIEERVGISDLQYSNFGDKLNITAWSKPFEMQVEFDPSATKTTSVDVDGKTIWKNELNIFDFGIIERAREDIFVETTIEYIKVTLPNGQILTKGDPRVDKLKYAKPIGFNQPIESGTAARNALEKQVLVEIDTELMQGAELEVKYAIKVTNNSEKDIDYYIEGTTPEYKTEYYYFGTNNEGSPEINASVNYVVDYLDSELTYTWENADDWTQKTADELLNEGLISEATYDSIKENNYATYITEKFRNLRPGEKITDHLTAKKLLANQDENVYDNHAEILKIDAKTARTIKETGKTKEYKMGNYVPSLATRMISNDINLEKAGLHEQDNDRLKVVITPPTGATNYIITYMITGLVGLMVIGAVIIFIKKKVLT